jgi:hypothetical protein
MRSNIQYFCIWLGWLVLVKEFEEGGLSGAVRAGDSY